MSTEPHRRHKTFAPRQHRPAPERPRKKRSRDGHADEPGHPELDPRLLVRPDEGRPLPAEVLRRLEASLGRPLAHVRVHTEPVDRERTRHIGARAFTYRHHIWLGPHESPSDVGLIAHEVAHVAQQGFAPPRAAAATARAAGVGHAAHPPAGLAAASARPAVPAVQRLELDLLGRARRAAGAVASGVSTVGRAVVRGARAVGGVVLEAGENLVSMARDRLLSIVRHVAPGFMPLFQGEGIGGFIRRIVERGLRGMFSGLLAPLRNMLNFSAISERVSQAVSWMRTIADQLSRNDCSGILAAARKVGEFFSTALKPFVDGIKQAADQVKGFFTSIWETIGAPIMDLLKRIGGTIWESLQRFVRDVKAIFRRVRDALGEAWDRVRGWFGIRADDGAEEGGGLWEWVKQKASAVGESISSLVRPVIGPLRSVGGVLLLLVPGGQLAAIMLLWPRLRQAWDWLSQKWTDLNLIPRAREFLANTVLPMLMDAAESVGQALVTAADWLLDIVERIARPLAKAAEAATGILGPVGRVISFAHQQFQRLIDWARGGLRFASRNMRVLLQRLVAFLGVVLDALRQLVAIVVNPFGIVGLLAGTIWRLIPECLKGPLIDFILDVIIAVLRNLPPLPTLGLLWPLIKSAALGFLEKVKSFAIARKVAVSNKMARIVSGMSPSFAFGYLRGLGLGLFDEITGPFQALVALFELPTLIQNFLSSLGARLCELIEKIRCFAATLAGRVLGSLDDVLAGLSELFGDPSRILDLIRCAIEGALAGAARLGATIADQLITVFESADDEIGERMGRLTATVVVQAVITYFTAGAGAAVGIARQIANALRAVGRAIRPVLNMLRGLLGSLLQTVRGLASRLARGAASGARSVLTRVGAFFRTVAAWFGRLLARIGLGFRRRFGVSARERVMWTAFRARVRGLRPAHPEGIAKSRLRGVYRGILNSNRPVAKWPAFITKHGPWWQLWVRRVKRPRPRIVGRVLLDRDTRWRQGKKAVKAAIKRLKRRPGNIDSGMIDTALGRVRRLYKYNTLHTVFDERENRFEVHGTMSPGAKVSSTCPERPTDNVIAARTASQHVRVNPLVKARTFRSRPSGSPPHWAEVEKIKTRSGLTSLYRRGHLASGFFLGGDEWNLTPITFSANSEMASRAETPVKRKLPKRAVANSCRPVFDYDVEASGTAGGDPPRRKFREGGRPVCKQVEAEKSLFRTITIRISAFGYSNSSRKWDRPVPLPSGTRPGTITNVPQFPRGFREPCRPTPES